MKDSILYRIGMLALITVVVTVVLIAMSTAVPEEVERVLPPKPNNERAEILQTQRIPRLARQQKGVVLILDLTVRGLADGRLDAMELQQEIAKLVESNVLQLWRDNGDEVWSSEDTPVSLQVEGDLDKKGRVEILLDSNESSMLLSGGEMFNEAGFAIEPHKRYRFFLVVSNKESALFSDEILPIPLTIIDFATGKEAEVIGEVLIDGRTFDRLPEAFATRDAFLQKNQSFTAGEGAAVVLSGDVLLKRTVIVPLTVKLVIQPGTTIHMEKDVSLISYAPVRMVGREDAPIRVIAAEEQVPWGVFAVVNSQIPSTAEWIEFSNGSQAYVNGIFFSGMLAFHGSPVDVSHAIFSHAHGDDGLNVKNSTVSIRNAHFVQNDFDGLDIDMATSGVVEQSTFIENGNDGLDISWSNIEIRDVLVDGSGDKCISVGEKSTPIIQDSVLKNCVYGIAVKDASRTDVQRVQLENNSIGIGAFVKKPFFGPPTVEVLDSVFIRNTTDTSAEDDAEITVRTSESS